MIPKTKEIAINFIENRVYEACQVFERLEDAGKLRGNGYHMAQKIAKLAGKLMKERWVDAEERNGAA